MRRCTSWIEIRTSRARRVNLSVQSVRRRPAVPPKYSGSVVRLVVRGPGLRILADVTNEPDRYAIEPKGSRLARPRIHALCDRPQYFRLVGLCAHRSKQ